MSSFVVHTVPGSPFARAVLAALEEKGLSEAAVAEAMPKAKIVFDELARLLGDQSYFAGEAPSLADLTLAPQIDFFSGIPEWGR